MEGDLSTYGINMNSLWHDAYLTKISRHPHIKPMPLLKFGDSSQGCTVENVINMVVVYINVHCV